MYEASSPVFRAAADAGNVEGMVRSAGAREALTLWHLIARVGDPDRERVVRTFALLVPKADTAGLLRRDPAAIDAAWNLLELGDTGWWRTWKQEWRTP